MITHTLRCCGRAALTAGLAAGIGIAQGGHEPEHADPHRAHERAEAPPHRHAESGEAHDCLACVHEHLARMLHRHLAELHDGPEGRPEGRRPRRGHGENPRADSEDIHERMRDAHERMREIHEHMREVHERLQDRAREIHERLREHADRLQDHHRTLRRGDRDDAHEGRRVRRGHAEHDEHDEGGAEEHARGRRAHTNFVKTHGPRRMHL